MNKMPHCRNPFPLHIGIALQDILALSNSERDGVVSKLDDVLQQSRAMPRAEP